MSFMNRKMFNRNARNKLNSMGGVASFQTGGSVFPSSLFGQSQFNKLLDQGYRPKEIRELQSGNRQFYINPRDTAADIKSSPMSYLQKIASQAKNQGIGSLSAIDQINLNMAMGQFRGSKMLPGLKRQIQDSEARPFVDALTEGFGAMGPGTLGGITSALFAGDPKDKDSFSGRLASARPNEEFLQSIGLETLPTQQQLLGEEEAFTGGDLPNVKSPMTKPPIAGGPTRQDPTLVDPTDPAVIDRIQSGIDVRDMSKNLQEGQGVRFNEKTGKYEPDPNFISPDAAEDEAAISGEMSAAMSPGRMQAQFGTSVLPRPKLADEPKPQPKDKPKVELGDPEEERGIAGELTKKDIATQAEKSNQADGIVKQDTPNAEIKTAIEKGTGSPEDLKAEFLKLLPKYDDDPSAQGLEIAQMFFNIAAGDSPDALTNIAEGLKKSVPAFIKRKDKRKAFERETELLAAKYVIQRREADRNRGFQKTDYYVTKDFEGPDGQKYTKGQPLKLNDQAFSLLQKQGLTGNLVSGTLYGKMLDNAAKVEKEKIKNAKGLDDYYSSSSKTKKIGQNIEIEVFYPTVTGSTQFGFKARPAGGIDQWKSVTRGYINDVNAIGVANNSLDSAIKLVTEKGALGTEGLMGRITDATKGVVPESIGKRMGLDYNKLSAGGELENLQRVMALQMARIILNEGGKMISNLERLQVARALGYTDAALQGTGPGAQLILGSYSNVFTSKEAAKNSLQQVQNILKQRARQTHSEYQEAADLFGYKLTGVDDKPKKGEKQKTITGKTLVLRDGKYYYE